VDLPPEHRLRNHRLLQVPFCRSLVPWSLTAEAPPIGCMCASCLLIVTSPEELHREAYKVSPCRIAGLESALICAPSRENSCNLLAF
jgi:hypothetical protein